MHERFRFKIKEELLAKASELSLDLPFSDDISPLFQPLSIDNIHVPNRLVVQPMEGYDSDPNGSPSTLTERRYIRYAEGGSGMIWFEAVAVSPDGRSNPGQLWIHEKNKEEFKSLVSKVREKAAIKGYHPALVIQLTHSGRYSKPDGKSQPMVAVPNPVIDNYAPHVLTDIELERIREDYIKASSLSAYAGFDAVDIKACHGYLMIDILAAKNRLNSDYGGDFPGRSGFMLEIVDQIRQAVPGIRLTSRLNISDMYPGGFGVDENNFPDFSDAFRLTAELGSRGVSFINLTMGSPYFNPHITRPYDNPLPDQNLPSEHPLEGVMRMIDATSEFSRQFPDISFTGSAYSWLRQFAPNVGAGVIKKGWAALIGLGRSSFAYPSMPEDLMKYGKADPSKVCITCSGCTRLIRNLRHGGCVMRDKEIYGKELKKLIADGK